MNVNPPKPSLGPVLAQAVAGFVVLVPLITWFLLWVRGLPVFAGAHPVEALVWVYQVTWIPALVGGMGVALALAALGRRLDYFVRPYDLGRAFSFGAITGSIVEAFATWIYRLLSAHLFSNFWIAGAMIAGCLAGALVTTVMLWSYARK